MKLLLDTHTLLWFVLGDARLSAMARQLIEDAANTRFVSPAAYWEIAIKISIGLPFHHRDPFDRLMIAQTMAEGVALVSADAAFDAYSVQRLW